MVTVVFMGGFGPLGSTVCDHKAAIFIPVQLDGTPGEPTGVCDVRTLPQPMLVKMVEYGGRNSLLLHFHLHSAANKCVLLHI